MSAALPIPVIQLLQVLTVAIAAPGVTGVIARVEARLQGRRGPRIRQPYYDLAKLFRKEALAPEQASWFFLAAPLIAVAAYLTIPLLIPVLTSYGLPLGYMGDILGGGFLLSLASFVVATAALETGSPYAQLGSSRAKTFSAIAEPVVLFVVFTVALLTGTDLPYALAATVRSSAGQIIRPAHLLATAALFMVILHETGRIPVETHTGTNEFGMIEEARSFEHSGPYFALLTWGSELKQLILYTILIDVFAAPWGLPLVMRRLLGRAVPDEEEPGGVAGSQTLSPASAVLAGIVLAGIGFFCFGALGLHGPAAPVTALAIAAAMVLVAFGLMIVRRDVASQAIGFFSLENAISLAALVVAAGLPLILATAFLFDLLVAVVVFGMLIRAHHARAESLSTADLTRLRG